MLDPDPPTSCEGIVPVHRVVDMTKNGRTNTGPMIGPLERELALGQGGGPQANARVEALRLAEAFRAQCDDAKYRAFSSSN